MQVAATGESFIFINETGAQIQYFKAFCQFIFKYFCKF
jgi:hypothetical protein